MATRQVSGLAAGREEFVSMIAERDHKDGSAGHRWERRREKSVSAPGLSMWPFPKIRDP